MKWHNKLSMLKKKLEDILDSISHPSDIFRTMRYQEKKYVVHCQAISLVDRRKLATDDCS